MQYYVKRMQIFREFLSVFAGGLSLGWFNDRGCETIFAVMVLTANFTTVIERNLIP